MLILDLDNKGFNWMKAEGNMFPFGFCRFYFHHRSKKRIHLLGGISMNTFAQFISNVFKGALKAFRTFPTSLGCALAFAVITAIRIQLDWQQQAPFNFLFNCLHWAFAIGAIFSLAAITAAQSRFNTAKMILFANLLGIAVVAVTFLGLYLFGGTELTGSRYTVVSTLAAARVSVSMFACFTAFIILAGYPKDRSDFTSSLFMTHKAFFIALIYGAVILAGTTGVARAIQALLYHEMSSKVYMYLGTFAGFLSYSIFVGYFPDFHKGATDERRETAQKQPRFIEILFGYIMIPIVLALTVVLLIWAGKTVLSGMQVPFMRLSVISASYTIGGLWLHAVVARYESGLAKFYRRVYPIASMVILFFEAWALVNQLQNSGLKLTEYVFILIWILAAIGVVLLLVLKSKAHQVIALLACILAIVSVLPAVGYHVLPVKAQISRLEMLLVDEGILNGDKLTPTVTEPSQDVRAAITGAVDYLANASDATLPAWFDKDLNRSDVFQAKLGFEKTWVEDDNTVTEPGGYLGTYLSLPPVAVDINGYSWAVNLQDEYGKGQGQAAVNGVRGTYQIYWVASNGGIPSIQILLDGRLILEQDLSGYIGDICKKYPPGQDGSTEATLEDMSLQLETSEADVLLVFSNIQINVDATNDTMTYWLALKDLYFRENP